MVPLGEYEELTEQGIPVTGTQNLGGSIVTAGGLVFIAATLQKLDGNQWEDLGQ